MHIICLISLERASGTSDYSKTFLALTTLVITITGYNDIRVIMIQRVCLLFFLRLFVCFNDNLDSYDIVILIVQNRYNQITFL